MSQKKIILPSLLIAMFITLVFMAYQQGKEGALFYDDLTNLAQLGSLDSYADAKEFVLGGSAGPLGRPVSLITFVPHASDWPENSSSAILVNIVIHIINGLLLLAIGYLVLVRSGLLASKQALLASFMAMALWISMPLLASTTLIIIQRMTSLASMLGLIGILGYLLLSRQSGDESLKRLLVKFSVLFCFTAVAMLAKENAVVFPIYVLILELVLLGRIKERRSGSDTLRMIRLSGLLIYAVLVIGYLVSKIPTDIFAYNPQRGFTFIDRLATQPLILWDYIRLALMPRLNAYGPFHDDIQVVSSFGKSLISTMAFLMILAIGLLLRKKFPMLLVAVLWFFCGHLVESTVIMLELYFEHRNYIAVYGIALMMACAVVMASERYKKILIGAFAAYVAMQFMILAMLTNIWGDSVAAAEHWAQVKPESSRAHMALSESYFRSLQNPSYANTALDRGLVTCPDCLDMYMQALIYGCLGEGEEKVRGRYEALYKAAPTGRFTPALLDGFYPLRDFLNEASCAGLSFDQIYMLLLQLETNPRFDGTENRIHLTYLKAVIASDIRDWDAALQHLDELLAIRRIFSAVTLEAQVLEKSQGKQAAMSFLEQVQEDPGDIGDVSRVEWDKRLQKFIVDMREGS